MSTYTKLQVITKVEYDLDLQEDTFIADTEMTGYANEAVRDLRLLISNIEEDYYLTYANLALVSGTAEYALPTDINAMKIRQIVYNDGSRIFPIKRFRNKDKFLQFALDGLTPTSLTEYRYMVIDDNITNGSRILLQPAAQITNSSFVTIWYLRDPVEVSLDADKLDMPGECVNFIYAHMKKSCLAKMNGGVAPAEANTELMAQAKLVVEYLSQMVPDNDDEIEQDLGHYEDHS